MADVVINTALSRVGAFYVNVQTNSPADSALLVVVLATGGESLTALKDYTTLATLLVSNPEVTNTGYSRKTLTDAVLSPFSPDNVNNRVDLDIPDQTWSAVQAGTNWGVLLVCYDPDTTGGTDATVIPLTAHDFAVTPDGTDITAQVNAAGFFRAS